MVNPWKSCSLAKSNSSVPVCLCQVVKTVIEGNEEQKKWEDTSFSDTAVCTNLWNSVYFFITELKNLNEVNHFS